MNRKYYITGAVALIAAAGVLVIINKKPNSDSSLLSESNEHMIETEQTALDELPIDDSNELINEEHTENNNSSEYNKNDSQQTVSENGGAADAGSSSDSDQSNSDPAEPSTGDTAGQENNGSEQSEYDPEQGQPADSSGDSQEPQDDTENITEEEWETPFVPAR